MGLNTQKIPNRAAILLIAYVALSGVIRARTKPFWCDEVITVELAKQPTLSAIWNAVKHAADSHPPLFYVLERLAGSLPLNEHIAFRLPSILAFCCIVLCIFLFIRKARGNACAVICAAIPLTSLLSDPYAVEARGYSLMAGFAALAMVSYQRADKVAFCALMGISLAAAGASHYYAIFATIPFALAEFVLVARVRRLRFGVWLALLVGALPLVVFWPLLQNLKKYYGSHLMGNLSLDEAVKSYGWFFNLPASVGVGMAATALAAVLIYGLLRRRGSVADNLNEIPVQEHILALGFLILPVVMYLAIRVLHGEFSSRYLLLTALGFPLAASYVLPVLDRRLLVLFSVLLLATLCAQEAVFWRFQLHSLGKKTSPAEGVEQLVKAAGFEDLPVVVSDPIAYLQLVYYASPAAGHRLIFLSDVPGAILYAGSDSADKCLLALRPYLPLQVYDFTEFARNHPEFLVYSDSKPKWDWWPTRLLHDGYTLNLVAINEGNRIYVVNRKH
jgi:hypothetical protein